jgi:hypothetical protein
MCFFLSCHSANREPMPNSRSGGLGLTVPGWCHLGLGWFVGGWQSQSVKTIKLNLS